MSPRVNRIIFIHPVYYTTGELIGEEDVSTIRQFVEPANLVVVTSRRERFPASNERYEKTLRAKSPFRELVNEGASMMPFDESEESARAVVERLIRETTMTSDCSTEVQEAQRPLAVPTGNGGSQGGSTSGTCITEQETSKGTSDGSNHSTNVAEQVDPRKERAGEGETEGRPKTQGGDNGDTTTSSGVQEKSRTFWQRLWSWLVCRKSVSD